MLARKSAKTAAVRSAALAACSFFLAFCSTSSERRASERTTSPTEPPTYTKGLELIAKNRRVSNYRAIPIPCQPHFVEVPAQVRHELSHRISTARRRRLARHIHYRRHLYRHQCSHDNAVRAPIPERTRRCLHVCAEHELAPAAPERCHSRWRPPRHRR